VKFLVSYLLGKKTKALSWNADAGIRRKIKKVRDGSENLDFKKQII